VHVQALLALVRIGILIHSIVMVMISVVVIMIPVVMVVAVMNMPRLITCVRVDQKSRECADRRCKGHTHGWRNGKYRRHRPNEGDAGSVCSFQSRQHAFNLVRVRWPLYGGFPLGTKRYR
jgi:hypothetical protein